MRLSPNTIAPTVLAFLVLVALVPIALVLIVVLRFMKSGVAPLDFVLALLVPAAVSDAPRTKGWKGVLDALAQARLL